MVNVLDVLQGAINMVFWIVNVHHFCVVHIFIYSNKEEVMVINRSFLKFLQVNRQKQCSNSNPFAELCLCAHVHIFSLWSKHCRERKKNCVPIGMQSKPQNPVSISWSWSMLKMKIVDQRSGRTNVSPLPPCCVLSGLCHSHIAGLCLHSWRFLLFWADSCRSIDNTHDAHVTLEDTTTEMG